MSTAPAPGCRLFVLSQIVVLAACGPGPDSADGPGVASGHALDQIQAAAGVIDAQRIRAGVSELADDAYAGRGPGTVGDRRAQAYIARTLAGLGYHPAAPDGSWFQPFELVSILTHQPRSWTFTHNDGS